MADALKRSMGLAHATSLVAGIILGASIFVQPSEITRLIQNPGKIMSAWLAAAGLTMCGALVCAELAAAFPETGGVYVYLKRIFSPALGFLWGWAMFWSIHSGIIAAIAVVMARYAAYFFSGGENSVRVIAMVAILFLSAVNYAGIKAGSSVQVVLTSAKIAALLLLVAVLFAFGKSAEPSDSAKDLMARVSLRSYALAVAAGLFSFGGWHMVTYSAGETHQPRRTIPMALISGTLIVAFCYMALNAGYLHVMSAAEIANSSRVAADAAQRVTGARAGRAISMLVIVSALGSLNGIILAGPRVYYAMARDGLAFRWLGALDARRQTPHFAILAQGIWSCVLVATNTYRQLFTRVVYTEWIFFALLAAGLYRLLGRPAFELQYLRGPLRVLPLAFIVASLGIVWIQISADFRASAIGVGLLLLGLPVYFLWTRRTPQGELQNARD